jgi:hypothetical protein
MSNLIFYKMNSQLETVILSQSINSPFFCKNLIGKTSKS